MLISSIIGPTCLRRNTSAVIHHPVAGSTRPASRDPSPERNWPPFFIDSLANTSHATRTATLFHQIPCKLRGTLPTDEIGVTSSRECAERDDGHFVRENAAVAGATERISCHRPGCCGRWISSRRGQLGNNCLVALCRLFD